MTTTSSIFDVIEQLSASLPLDPAKVGEILHAPLAVDPEADEAVLTVYGPAPGTKPKRYGEVELRIPDPVFGSGGGLLKVALKGDEGVDSKAIFKRYGLQFQKDVPSPRHPPGLPAYYNYEQPWGSLSLGVTHDKAAKLVSFVMKPKAP